MRIATLPDGSRDGRLVVVSTDGTRAVPVPDVPTVLHALENWTTAEGVLRETAAGLDQGRVDGIEFDEARALAPLPRTWQWLDASVYANHGRLMAQALGTAAPQRTDPLMYQGLSHRFLAPQEDVELRVPEDDLDFEGEIGVVLDEVPAGASVEEAAGRIRFLVLINDWSLRRWAAIEMARGFGFIQAKPASALAPLLVTPDEIGAAWHGGVLSVTVRVERNGAMFGDVPTDEVDFSFPELIAYAARSRNLPAGTVLGAGTVSSGRFAEVGSACISERRGIEQIDAGASQTPYLAAGETVRIEVLLDGRSVFGTIRQKVVAIE